MQLAHNACQVMLHSNTTTLRRKRPALHTMSCQETKLHRHHRHKPCCIQCSNTIPHYMEDKSRPQEPISQPRLPPGPLIELIQKQTAAASLLPTAALQPQAASVQPHPAADCPAAAAAAPHSAHCCCSAAPAVQKPAALQPVVHLSAAAALLQAAVAE